VYRFKTSEDFWASFYALSSPQKERVRQVWQIFKANPFDARLRTHKIHRLSARYGTTIYSVVVEGNLRVLFHLQGNVVTTLDVGTHDVYR
jgi:hypothetical protein